MRISVDGSRIRNNKVAFSNLSGIVWTRPKQITWVCFKLYKEWLSLLFQDKAIHTDYSGIYLKSWQACEKKVDL